MGELIDTTEMYLRTIFELCEEGVPPLRARIAERLRQSGPTVSETVARMERDGLVRIHVDRQLELSESGLRRAAEVMRRHRLAERLLTDVIGLEWQLVHNEACRWEHVISTDVERRLVQVLDHPVTSPYGNPIPNLAELGESIGAPKFLDGVVSLASKLGAGGAQRVRLERIGEALQSDSALLERLAAGGLTPGAEVWAELDPRQLRLGGQDHPVALPIDVAEHLFVSV
jgi:DtxR family transcriptional regulator, Mn-dependent transcriptional regulator